MKFYDKYDKRERMRKESLKEGKAKDMLLQKIIDIVEKAGDILLCATDIEESVEEKSGRANFVTLYDKKVQDFLFERLAEILPEAVFIGEEQEEHASLPEGYAFIIDPIDGTTNFMKGYRTSCVSVGLVKAGKPEIGVVYNPYQKEMFWAKKGEGAFCNGKRLRVSSHALSEGVVLVGTSPYNEELSKRSFAWAYELFVRSLDIRRSGSAALDLCSLAAGRAEFYFELLLSPWDFAAGALILEEAGGKILTAEGKELCFGQKSGVAAGNPVSLRAWQKLLEEGILI